MVAFLDITAIDIDTNLIMSLVFDESKNRDNWIHIGY